MKGGWNDGVEINPWSAQQQIIGRVSIDDIIYHLGFQIPDLASELDFAYWAHTIGVETINSSLSSVHSVGGDSQVLHDPASHNAQHGP